MSEKEQVSQYHVQSAHKYKSNKKRDVKFIIAISKNPQFT